MKFPALFLFALLAAGSLNAELKTVADVAQPPKRAAGAPTYSDVCFSPRWRRPRDADDPHDTFRDARAFHATRFDWVYSSDPEWIAECRKRGYWFTGTVNSILTDPETGKREKGRIQNHNGDRIAAPWMRKWSEPGYWGCANSPHYREIYLAQAKTLIDGGVDAIQMDDPGLNYTAVSWGACYCEHCKEKAKKQGKELSKEMMKAFQEESIREFYIEMRKEIDAYAKRRIPWSSNNYGGNMAFPYDLFDYGTAELPHGAAKPDQLYNKIMEATRKGRQQIYTYVSTDVAQTRRVIAMGYACGGHVIVPYDVWHGNRPRIFGTPEQYGDLYGFVRAIAPHLDGHEDAAIFSGGRIREGRYGKHKPVEIEAKEVYAMTRAQPGKADAPTVVHLVDWRESPETFQLKLRPELFHASGRVELNLLVPPEYDAAAHNRAADSGEFSALAKTVRIPTKVQGGWVMAEIPALNPWGVLVVSVPESNKNQ